MATADAKDRKPLAIDPGSPGDGAKGAPAMPVRAFGKYFLVRKIAEGGMAEIFLAKQVGAEGFERNVVIKRMLQHLSSVQDFVGMFLDEARLAARLAHQNIIQINDLGLADGCYYISMEYLAGEDFSTVLRTAGRRRTYVPLNVALRVVAEAAHGLHFAHEFTDDQGRPLNIVHRDISPSNIYVTYQGQVKLLDFGIAKAESRVTNTTAGVVKGKYMYMAPEQARGASVDRRADVFSLGVSLYEAVTNVRPFAKDNDLAILNAVLQCDYLPPRQLRPDLPPEIEAVILKALAPKVGDRYQTAGQMAADLEKYVAENTSSTGGSQVSSYLKQFFGEERFQNKTRIPTLASMAATGIDVPGFSNPRMPKTEPEGLTVTEGVYSQQTEGSTRMVAPLPVAQEGKPRSQRLVLVAALGALVAGGALLAAYQVFRPTPSDPKVSTGGTKDPVKPPENPVKPPENPVKPPEATPDAGPLVSQISPPKPILLTGPIVQGVVNKNIGNIMKCSDQFKSDLLAEGKTTLKFSIAFTIVGSGKVSEATLAGDIAGTRLANCFEGKIRNIRFPAHKDREVSLTMPFSFQVQK